MKKLKELYELQSAGQLDYGIEYSDGSEEGDLFDDIQIINPENEYSLIYSWVPVDMVQQLEDEKELTQTTNYHDWTSQLTDYNERCSGQYKDKKELEQKKKMFVDDWNSTELGGRYPIDIYDIFDICMEEGTYKLIIGKEFNIF